MLIWLGRSCREINATRAYWKEQWTRKGRSREVFHANEKAQGKICPMYTIESLVSLKRTHRSLKDVKRSLRINQILRSPGTGGAQPLFVRP